MSELSLTLSEAAKALNDALKKSANPVPVVRTKKRGRKRLNMTPKKKELSLSAVLRLDENGHYCPHKGPEFSYGGIPLRTEVVVAEILFRNFDELDLVLMSTKPGYRGIDITSLADPMVAFEVEGTFRSYWLSGQQFIKRRNKKTGLLEPSDHLSIPVRKKPMFEKYPHCLYVKTNFYLTNCVVVKGIDILNHATIETKTPSNVSGEEDFFIFRGKKLEKYVNFCSISGMPKTVKRLLGELKGER